MAPRIGTMPAVEVPGITPVPYPYGLFSVVTPAPFTDNHAMAGVWWQGAGCQVPGVTHDPCVIDDVVPALDPNVVCNISTGSAFTVYARSDQSIGGRPLAERQQQARDVLYAGEQFVVEGVVWDLLVAHATSEGSAATMQEAVARLEGVLRSTYFGTGIVHATPFGATMAAQSLAVRIDGSKARTFLGTPLAAGGGYGDPTTLLTDQVVFATGAMQIFRSDVIDLGQMVDKESNIVQSVVQRTYVVGWDCVALSISL